MTYLEGVLGASMLKQIGNDPSHPTIMLKASFNKPRCVKHEFNFLGLNK